MDSGRRIGRGTENKQQDERNKHLIISAKDAATCRNDFVALTLNFSPQNGLQLY